MAHDHLTFLRHGERPMTNIGGFDVPVIVPSGNSSQNRMMEKSSTEKLIDVVDYLQTLPPGQKVGVESLMSNCSVDLEGSDYAVLDSLKNNPKVEIEDNDGILYFKYRAKYEIRNRFELVQVVDKVKSGVPRNDISDCYPGVTTDVEEMILTGEVIACKNKEAKDIILFPRGPKFITRLSGVATAYPMRQNIKTTDDLTNEIRRGDAIFVGENWYRVTSAISSTKSNQPERAKAPFSVSSVQELSERNVYIDEYSADVLPLDGDYDGSETYTGPVYKYGCTNDLRQKWIETGHLMKAFKSEKDLLDEMVKLNLISSNAHAMGTSQLMARNRTQKANEAGNKLKGKKRIKRKFARITNLHLEGTELAQQLEEEEAAYN